MENTLKITKLLLLLLLLLMTNMILINGNFSTTWHRVSIPRVRHYEKFIRVRGSEQFAVRFPESEVNSYIWKMICPLY